MDFKRKMMSFLKLKPKEEELSPFFLKNGSMLLEEFIKSFNGRHNIPIRSFSAKELNKATSNFAVSATDLEFMFEGFIENRRILVKRVKFGGGTGLHSDVIRDVVLTSHMSHHKNVLKLVGCCLEFEIPALVYEFAGTECLSNLLFEKEPKRSLSWGKRLRIAKDIANVLVYLHSAFPTPIIYRDLKPDHVVVDEDGVAKIMDFSLSISLPPGESQVEELVIGTIGYLAPEYAFLGILTEKCDVFSFGMFLLALLTGQNPVFGFPEPVYPEECGGNNSGQQHFPLHTEAGLESQEQNFSMATDVREFDDGEEWKRFIKTDPRVLEEGGGMERDRQLQAFRDLAFKCIRPGREDRPKMIEVARELVQMHRSSLHF